MSVKKGPVSVLREKAKAKAMTLRMGNHRAVVTRSKSTFAEKAQALKVHREMIHGFRHGNIVNHGGINPGTAWTYDGEGNRIVTFRGDGLPDDSVDTLGGPKYSVTLNGFMVVTTPEETAAKPKKDKRAPFAAEMKAEWKPRPFGWRKARNGTQV